MLSSQVCSVRNRRNNNNLLLLVFVSFVIIFTIFVFVFIASKFSFPNFQATPQSKVSTSSFTSYDRELAMKFMDENHDGKCDICGMDVESCIAIGQIQCNMDPKSTIGVLGSQYIHANFKVYIKGIPIDFNNSKYERKSSFIHIHLDNPYKLHMHDTGVPLWIFFESIGMKFDKNCLILDNGDRYCNDIKNTLKFYVNEKPNDEFENYVFKDSYRILISYGDETDLTQQLNSITNFTKEY
jgi:hypothetical protein